jgi:hypothetical protein
MRGRREKCMRAATGCFCYSWIVVRRVVMDFYLHFSRVVSKLNGGLSCSEDLPARDHPQFFPQSHGVDDRHSLLSDFQVIFSFFAFSMSHLGIFLRNYMVWLTVILMSACSSCRCIIAEKLDGLDQSPLSECFICYCKVCRYSGNFAVREVFFLLE